MSDSILNKSIGEVLAENVGTVTDVKVFHNSTAFLIMFSNNYSVHVSKRNSRKHSNVEVYHGIGNITSSFFTGRSNRKVRNDSVMPFIDKIGEL